MYKLPTKIGQALVGQWYRRTSLSINCPKQRVLPTIACDISVKRTYTEGTSARSYDVIKSSCSDVEIPNESLPEFLFKKFSEFPERPAIVSKHCRQGTYLFSLKKFSSFFKWKNYSSKQLKLDAT